MVDHTNNFAYVFLDDMIEYKFYLKELSLTVNPCLRLIVQIDSGPYVTFTSTGRKIGLPNRMELYISQLPEAGFTQMPTAFMSEPLRRIFYWEIM